MNALYVMVSLPPISAIRRQRMPSRLIEQAVLPHCEEHDLAFALMAGCQARRQSARCAKRATAWAARTSPRTNGCSRRTRSNSSLMTALSRENQHELCVLGRKFRNLHIFGCWWFTNVPSIIDEMTRMRIELLGLSMTPQHSDARVLEQLIYKWRHSRQVIAGVLKEKYRDLAATGWRVTEAEI